MTTIVIPTYKEAINIPMLLKRIDAALSPGGISFEVVIVDDNSCDGTEELIQEFKPKYNIHLIVRKDKRGLSSAVIDGIKHSNGDVIVVMDADLSHPPEKLPELIEQIENKKADFTIGSRFVEGGSSPYFNFYRKINALISKLLAMPLTRVKDPMAGFFAFRKNLIKDIENLNPLGFKIGLEIIVKTSPGKITEIPITFEERFGGDSKLNLKEQINYLIHLRRLYQYKYTRFTQMTSFAFIGCLGMVLDLSMVYICYKYLNIPYSFARVSGFIFALTLNFILNRKVTFPDAKHDRIINQYVSFFAVCLLGMFVNWSISVFLYNTTPFFNKHYLFAAFIGIMAGFLLNFTGSRLYVFRGKVLK